MIRAAVFNAHPTRRAAPEFIARVVRRTLRAERVAHGAITVVFVASGSIRRINREFLGHDRVTDVISFPLERNGALEGEIYVNLDRAAQQAAERGLSRKNEVTRLVVHGLLHLVGYDDRSPGKARQMHARQEALVKRLSG
jgi:rRNA maturation RNase YbeY